MEMKATDNQTSGYHQEVCYHQNTNRYRSHHTDFSPGGACAYELKNCHWEIVITYLKQNEIFQNIIILYLLSLHIILFNL